MSSNHAVTGRRKSVNAMAVLLGLAFASLFAALPADATTFAPVGGRGDRQEEVRCPDSHILVGFSGRRGRWVDQLSLMCARLQIPGYTTHEVVTLSPRGGGGGVHEERYCERNAGIRGVVLYVGGHVGLVISGLEFSCAVPANGSPRQGQMFGELGSSYPQMCPGSEYATGVTIHYGAHVNALGLICSAIADWPPTSAPKEAAAEKVDAGMENNTDRPGSDYDRFHINDQRPDRCQSECLLQRDRCKAWTYVRPGIQHKHAVCYLKNTVPPARSNTCCISGVLPSKSRTGVTQGPGGFVPAPSQQPPAAPPSSPSEPADQLPATPEPPRGNPGANANAGEPYGFIGEKYAALGGAGGPLGAPTGSETDAPHGGRCHQFRNGTICWHPQIGEAFGVWGLIHAKWSTMGRTEFGYPITDERPTPDGRGRFNHFRGMQYPGRPESSIYWTPQTGAHAIYGLIRDAWAKQGWERGPLGYPTSDEHQDGKYRRVNFERGHIRWAPDTGIQINQ
jgi:hypothetical protein